MEKTKQESRFHIVLGSSASFFHLWIRCYLPEELYKSYIISDLCHDEAKRYWTEQLIPQLDWQGYQPPPFDKEWRWTSR